MENTKDAFSERDGIAKEQFLESVEYAEDNGAPTISVDYDHRDEVVNGQSSSGEADSNESYGSHNETERSMVPLESQHGHETRTNKNKDLLLRNFPKSKNRREKHKQGKRDSRHRRRNAYSEILPFEKSSSSEHKRANRRARVHPRWDEIYYYKTDHTPSYGSSRSRRRRSKQKTQAVQQHKAARRRRAQRVRVDTSPRVHSPKAVTRGVSTDPAFHEEDGKFIGDVSEWGKTENPEMTEDERGNHSHNSLSSGVSPRAARPATKAWNAEDAFRALVYNSRIYASATDTVFRDNLQSRVAFQHLNVLAGMAGKVQDVILRNRSIFQRRMIEFEINRKRSAFLNWKSLCLHRADKNRKYAGAINKLSKGILARSFFAWNGWLSVMDRQSLLLKKAGYLQIKGLQQRCLIAWLDLCGERNWKKRVHVRDEQIHKLEGRIKTQLKRRVDYFKHGRLKTIFNRWKEWMHHSNNKKWFLAKAIGHYQHKQCSRAWNAWLAQSYGAENVFMKMISRVHYNEHDKEKQVLLKRALVRIRKVKLSYAWNGIVEFVENQHRRRYLARRSMQHFQQLLLCRSWRQWITRTRDRAKQLVFKMKRAIRETFLDTAPKALDKKLKSAMMGTVHQSSLPRNVLLRLEDCAFGTLKRRYKRFLADVVLEESMETVTAHCPNTGPLLGLLNQTDPAVVLSRSADPKRKCPFTVEAIQLGGGDGKWIGIHSALANKLVRRMLDEKMIPEFADYETIKAEAVYGKDRKSRADFLLSRNEGAEKMLIEVKAVTYSELQGEKWIGLFPDTTSTRAQKHLNELMDAMNASVKASCILVVMGNTSTAVGPFKEKDAKFAELMVKAHEHGVHMMGIGLELQKNTDHSIDFVFQRFLEIDLQTI